MLLDFDKIFWPTVIALRISGAHPIIPKDKKWFLRFFILHGLFTVIFFLISYSVSNDFKKREFVATSRNGSICALYTELTIQYFSVILNQDLLVKIINIIKNDYEKVKNTPDNAKIVAFYARKGNWVSIQWLLLDGFAFSAFIIKNVFLYTLHWYKKDDFIYIPLYEFTYPPIIEQNRDNIFIYLMMYVLMLHMVGYIAIMFIAFVPLGPMFMLHACGQLQLIKNRIDNMYEGHSDAEIKTELKCIVRELQFVYNFVEDVNECFSVLYELILKGASVILPITVFAVIKSFNTGEVSIEFITVIVGGFMISSTPCYYSDVLMEKGEEVRQAIYACGWEQRYDRSTRATLLIILVRCVRPISIQTIFRPVCLETLTDVYQQAYALFNLMNAMFD